LVRPKLFDSFTSQRPYQERAAGNFYGNGCANSRYGGPIFHLMVGAEFYAEQV
jgi:hypothetical protein